MKTNFIKIIVLSILIPQVNLAQTSFKKDTITPQELSSWRTLDKGKTTVQGDELIVEETDGADGYFLISPKSYSGDVILNYKIKALSESSVLIVLLSASDNGESKSITLPSKESKGPDFWMWRTHLEHYNLTFNNVSHGYKPFFYKNITPYKRGFYQTRPDNVMSPLQWYDVEIGKQGANLWFKLNNKIIFEQEDYKPLSGGHVIFRISGTNGKQVILAKAVIKDLVISHQ
ncbi:hypothetical protein [Aquimarina sp. 2201CG5-10]|uniref:hypothetical protein n=1 Tax=Aquimarina callyspongiae TaxID=3098150 RepID=UPI002AB4738E|nr:hypothetical protein [Aquimarina sp. 2201CG5-10]MDY8135993.1 hypothetical protein [Aquimarina sp. 2201CG5-10]